MATRAIIGVLLAGTLTLFAGCSGAQPSASASPGGTPAVASAAPTTPPEGFKVLSGDRFTLFIPSAWNEIPTESRYFAPFTTEVGLRFTGQAVLPPRLAILVDRSSNLGTATSQAQFMMLKVRSEIADAKIGDLAQAQVAGAASAVWFDYQYHKDEEMSARHTVIKAADYKVRDLTVQVAGTPMFTLRYMSEATSFDERAWSTMVGSLRVSSDG